MLRKMIHGVIVSGTAVGALLATSITAMGAQPVEQAWATASPVQVYGTAPSNQLPGGQGAPPVQLLNDPEAGGEVFFMLDGQERSLKPGETMDLAADRPHMVEFNTGGSFGDLKFTLYQGQYKFKVMPEGWALFKSSQQSSVAGQAPAASGSMQMRRSYSPPLPAEDLRTRRMAGRTDGTTQSGGTARQATPAPIPAPAAGIQQPATPTIAAPPAPGVIRERTAAPKAP